jgi:hypothetical protein
VSRRAVRATEIDALIGCAEARGLTVEAVEITIDGAVRVLTRRPSTGVALNDDVSWVDLAGETKAAGRA